MPWDGRNGGWVMGASWCLHCARVSWEWAEGEPCPHCGAFGWDRWTWHDCTRGGAPDGWPDVPPAEGAILPMYRDCIYNRVDVKLCRMCVAPDFCATVLESG